MFSDIIIDNQAFNDIQPMIPATWETSTVRSFLNNDFMSRAFNDKERDAIKQTTVKGESNQETEISGGNDTVDNIYLLSINEAKNEAYGFCSDGKCYSKSRQLSTTAYAYAMCADDDWLLRMPGYYDDYLSNVFFDGTINYLGLNNYCCYGIAPVLCLDLNQTKVYSLKEKEALFDIDDTEEISFDPIESQIYSGRAVTPELNVYYGDTLLTKGLDYTVTYKNNTNAYTLSEEDDGFNKKKAPTVIIKGKGNFTGSETVYFKILPKDLDTEEITVYDIGTNIYNPKKDYKPVPTVTFGKKKLAVNKDFTIKYYDSDACIDGTEVNPRAAKPYWAKLTGKGNYEGEVKKSFTIAEAGKVLVSKLKIGKLPSKPYTGEEITLEEKDIVVKNGKTTLTCGVDYNVSYSNNVEVGTATVTIIGSGEKYVGSRKVTFNITGTPLKKVKITGFKSSLTYNGDEVKQEALTLTYTPKGGTAETVKCEEKSAYESFDPDKQKKYGAVITYTNNVKTGKATMTLTGVNGFSGTVKKTFKIVPYNISVDSESLMNAYFECGTDFYYSKAGVKPEPIVKFDGTTLKKGTDYTVSYQNNKAANAGKTPIAKITGKGNFKGVITREFSICSVSLDASGIEVKAADKMFANKAGNWKSTVTLTDNGAKLSAGKDYDKTVEYTYASLPSGGKILDGAQKSKPEKTVYIGDEVGAKDIVPAGTLIKATVTAKGNNYYGQASCTYRITKEDIGKVKVSINSKTYTGQDIILGENDIKFYNGSKLLDLKKNVDYEILSYKNNINKGKATVVIKGIGNYGGTRSVTFNIVTKKILWW